MATREYVEDIGDELQDDLEDLNDSIEDLRLSTTDPYYSDYQNVHRLIGYLIARIDVMNESWDLSLDYSVPESHNETILAPIARDNDANGINVNKTAYENEYPGSRPVEK